MSSDPRAKLRAAVATLERAAARRDQLVRDALDAGMSVVEVAEIIGRSRKIVRGLRDDPSKHINEFATQNMRPPYKSLTSEQENQVVHAYLEGASTVRLSRLFNVSIPVISEALRRAKVRPRRTDNGSGPPRALDKRKAMAVVEAYVNGVRVVDLAKRFELHETTIRLYLRRYADVVQDMRERRGLG